MSARPDSAANACGRSNSITSRSQKTRAGNSSRKRCASSRPAIAARNVVAAWLRAAGFDLRTERSDGRQFGFSALDGRFKGHIDGCLLGGAVAMQFPALWETKALGAASWKEVVKKGVVLAKPIYAAQIALYQAYLDLPNPALFTALNRDTWELHAELVPFDAALAQSMSDKAVQVVQASEAQELLPRAAADKSSAICRGGQHRRRLASALRLAGPVLEVGAMTDITPSDTQARAIAAIKDWFNNRTREQQVFRLFGYAGTGKSTVLKFALAELGLDPHKSSRDSGECVPGVVTATFTGKAALVLRRKGTPARTIHSLIYSVIVATDEEIEAADKKIHEARLEAAKLAGFDRTAAEAAIEAMCQAMSQMKKPRFALNPQSDAAHARLIVLDEVSMVGEEMARDLMSFGKPILVLGDPGQLPPIKGEGTFTKDAPDIMLTEIHRQAAESAIIRLATMARQGEPIGFGQYDTFVWKMRKMDVTPEQCLRGGQVICGLNATRLQLNNAMRRAAGFGGGWLPTGQGEKIICLKNQNDLGLINGMFLTLEDIVDEGSVFFSARVLDEEGNPIGRPGKNGKREQLRIYKGHFEDHVAFDRQRHDRDWKNKRLLAEATFGWAITAHKAQGSSWGNVIVWDDGLGKTAIDRARWLYTAITRAEQGLVILS